MVANQELEKLQRLHLEEKKESAKELQVIKNELSAILKKRLWTEGELAKECGRRANAKHAIQKVFSDIVNASV